MAFVNETEGSREAVRVLAPALPPDIRSDLYRRLLAVQDKDDLDFAGALRRLGREYSGDARSRTARATCLLIADLVEQGWRLAIEEDRFVFEPPGLRQLGSETVSEVKERVRISLRRARDRQLAEPSVRQFIRKMERRTLRTEGRTSVLDLVDSGSELRDAFVQVNALPEEQREAALAGIIRPEVHVCDPDAKCPHTGLRLLDVWRYFRHTWSLEYRPIPGRQMPVLIRNSARPNAPVIGIAMLASPALRQKSRDTWIGWRLDVLKDRLEQGVWEPEAVARALDKHISVAIGEIRWDDLVTVDELEQPAERVVMRLAQKAAGAAEERLQELREHYSTNMDESGEGSVSALRRGDPAEDWRLASADLLYVRKRAENLSKLLEARLVFNEARLLADPAEALRGLLESKVGRKALEVALTEIRKSGLASRVADVSVCGAIAPYADLLGGKLVTLLIASQEVRDLYKERYGDQVSLIASQLAGFAVRRPAQLEVLTTTSLYGIGSSQYNRLKLRKVDHPELPSDVVWEELGVTEGYGTAHLSAITVQALRELSSAVHGARRVNNVFGEGSSPRLRQIREGLDALGVTSDKILHHATPRIVYTCELVPGAREHLMGLNTDAPIEAPTVDDISAAWRRRWLKGRIQNKELLDRLARQGPLTVQGELWADEKGQFSLFDQPNR